MATPNENLFHLIAVNSYEDAMSIMMALSSIEDLVKTQGADPSYVNTISGMPLLSHAIQKKNASFVAKLLELGANPNQPCANGVYPLVYAAMKLPTLVIPLFENGAIMHQEYFHGGKRTTVGEVVLQMTQEADLKEIASFIEERVRGHVVGNKHTLFDCLEATRELEREKHENRKAFLQGLIDSGPQRELRKSKALISFDGQDDLSEADIKFPNFANVLTMVRRNLALQKLSDNGGLTMKPILMVGPAGIGKTRFVSYISKVIGMEMADISCGGISAGWVIGGSSTSWSEGKPGMVFSTMRDLTSSNPIILLDEIDKLGGDHRFDGFGSLYGLLEQHTAGQFKDEAVALAIDCSKVSWIATANDLNAIPKPIISRFNVVEVDAPSPDQMPEVILSIYRDILESNMDTWGSRFSQDLCDNVIDRLINMVPRDVSKRLFESMGHAALSRSMDVYELLETDLISNVKVSNGIGFLNRMK